MTVTIISPPELKLLLRATPPITVIDARGTEDHLKGHVPFSIPMNWECWSARPPAGASLDLSEPGYWGELAAPGALDYERRFTAAGISNDIPVVVYADGRVSKGREGRIAWMLLYLGVRHVCILNGGWSAWVNSGGEIEEGENRVRPGEFKIRTQPARRVTFHQLRHHYLRGTMPCSVDTRLLTEFQGLSYDYQPRPGHLPGASPLTFESLFEENGQFVSKSRFFTLTPPDVLLAENLFTYCEVGVRASTYAMLYEAYTGRVLPVYDGSIMEWGLYKELPVLAGN